MNLGKEDKMKRYHYEEVLLILFISASDLSGYDEDDLIFFAEDIEGRADDLFETDYLEHHLNQFLKTDKEILHDFNSLRDILISMYASQWHKKLKGQEPDRVEANRLAKKILNAINVDYVEPIIYAEGHLNID
jgi:hypothetical protein